MARPAGLGKAGRCEGLATPQVKGKLAKHAGCWHGTFTLTRNWIGAYHQPRRVLGRLHTGELRAVGDGID